MRVTKRTTVHRAPQKQVFNPETAKAILARSSFESSMHYQSLMALGTARVIDDVWAGILPIISTYGTPIAADNLQDGIPVPNYIATWPTR